MAEVCVQINAWGDLVESFIAAMALYSTSKVKLRKLVRACWQSSTQEEWKVAEVSYEHTLCSGGTKNASPRALQAEAAKFINSNTNMTALSLKNS